MKNMLAVMGAFTVVACGSVDRELGQAGDADRRLDNADGASEASEASDTDASLPPAESGLDAQGVDVLNDLGLGLPDHADQIGVGTVVVTPASTGVGIEMEGLAIQLQSDDRFYDNTLVYAWSGLDVDAGTAEYLLRFRAAGLAQPGALPLDALSNRMLPSWVIFSDEANATTYYNEDGTLTIDAVTLDPATEVDCTTGFEVATCSTGTVEGDIDMSSLGYDGFGAEYLPPADRGVSTATLDVTVTFDVPVERTSIER